MPPDMEYNVLMSVAKLFARLEPVHITDPYSFELH